MTHLEELERLLKEATPGKWHTCNPNCPCRQMWAEHHPIAKFENGEWGDQYCAIREGADGMPEAYTRRIPYGKLAEGAGEANLQATTVLHNAAPWLISLVREAEKMMRQAPPEALGVGGDGMTHWFKGEAWLAKLERGPDE